MKGLDDGVVGVPGFKARGVGHSCYQVVSVHCVSPPHCAAVQAAGQWAVPAGSAHSVAARRGLRACGERRQCVASLADAGLLKRVSDVKTAKATDLVRDLKASPQG
jgi:hypothetical protein